MGEEEGEGEGGHWWRGLNLIRQSFPGLVSFSGNSWFPGGHPLARRRSDITVMGTHPEGCLSQVKERGIPGGRNGREGVVEKDGGERRGEVC